MGATTTPLISLLPKLKEDYPSFQFTEGEHFLWSPENQTVFFTPDGDPTLLLHELGHALLKHADYERDVQLLTMERAAWEKAFELGELYGVTVPVDTAEDHLDTYRDWLHARSTCPTCTATGFQSASTQYTCPACSQVWAVNEARLCQLRRVRTGLA